MTRLTPGPDGRIDAAAVQRYLNRISRWARSRHAGRPLSQRLRRARRRSWTMSLNLTPMIDVVFLLLFFFLVVTRFGAGEGVLPAQIPTRSTPVTAEVPRAPLRVRLVMEPPDGRVEGGLNACRVTIDRFNETPIDMSALAAALRKIREMNVGFDEQAPVHLIAGDEIAWDHVVNAYNAALAAEFYKIYFAGSP